MLQAGRDMKCRAPLTTEMRQDLSRMHDLSLMSSPHRASKLRALSKAMQLMGIPYCNLTQVKQWRA